MVFTTSSSRIDQQLEFVVWRHEIEQEYWHPHCWNISLHDLYANECEWSHRMVALRAAFRWQQFVDVRVQEGSIAEVNRASTLASVFSIL